jgi:hypothetical protein
LKIENAYAGTVPKEMRLLKGVAAAGKLPVTPKTNLVPTNASLVAANKDLVATKALLVPTKRVLVAAGKVLGPPNASLVAANEALVAAKALLVPTKKVLVAAKSVLVAPKMILVAPKKVLGGPKMILGVTRFAKTHEKPPFQPLAASWWSKRAKPVAANVSSRHLNYSRDTAGFSLRRLTSAATRATTNGTAPPRGTGLATGIWDWESACPAPAG